MVDILLDRFKNFRVLVVGDVMIDAYWKGSVSRVSPEAPVPVLELVERDFRLGGAANVALNLVSLGATPILCSVIGKDRNEEQFYQLLEHSHLSKEGILSFPKRTTTIKYRMIANQSQLLRVDEENTQPLNENEQKMFLAKIDEILAKKKIDAIIFEDYDKGLLGKELITKIVSFAKEKNIVITVDPKNRNFHYYSGVTLFKPNLKELKEGLKITLDNFNFEKIKILMKEFSHTMSMNYIMTTLSEKGIVVYDQKNDNFYAYPAYLRKISDVSGAGDTMIAITTLLLIAQLSIDKIAMIANLAGGIVCEYAGVVSIDPAILKEQIVKEGLLF